MSATAPTRVIFLDLARAAATLMMLQGHTADALLGMAYRAGPAFDAWNVVRGLTSPAFLLVSGLTFGVVTAREFGRHDRWDVARRRLRRFGFFLLLGYFLHFPAANIAGLRTLPPEGWQAFAAVDVLQCIAASLGVLQLVAVLASGPGVFAAAAIGLTVAACGLAPLAWRLGTDLPLPGVLAAYLSPASGSLFPLLPWLAYCSAGAALGVVGMSRAATHGAGAGRWLAPLGAVLLALALTARATGWEAAVVSGPVGGQPSQFLFNSGCVCLALAVLSVVSGWLRERRLPLVEAFGRESLLVYIVHLCVVYGSAWNYGLRQYVGPTLTPLAVAGAVGAMWLTMAALAVVWSRFKQRQPVVALRVRLVTLGLLLVMLLV